MHRGAIVSGFTRAGAYIVYGGEARIENVGGVT